MKKDNIEKKTKENTQSNAKKKYSLSSYLVVIFSSIIISLIVCTIPTLIVKEYQEIGEINIDLNDPYFQAYSNIFSNGSTAAARFRRMTENKFEGMKFGLELLFVYFLVIIGFLLLTAGIFGWKHYFRAGVACITSGWTIICYTFIYILI